MNQDRNFLRARIVGIWLATLFWGGLLMWLAVWLVKTNPAPE